MSSTPTTSRSPSTPSPTPPLTGHRSSRTVPAPPSGDRSGPLRVRGQNGVMPARDWKQRAYRVFDRFVPTVPFRYLPPKQSVRMAFNVILDREPDPVGGADYMAKLAA